MCISYTTKSVVIAVSCSGSDKKDAESQIMSKWAQLIFFCKDSFKTNLKPNAKTKATFKKNPQPRSCSGQLVLSAACYAFPQGGLFVSCVCSSIPSPETLITCDCWADTHTKKKETANQTAISIIGRPRHNRAHSSICMIWLKKKDI